MSGPQSNCQPVSVYANKMQERFHCFDYYSSPILEGCYCFVLHINGYTDSLLGAPTVILNKVTCGYISNEWATPFFSTQFCYWGAVHLVPVNYLLSILNNMKLAEYELKLIFVIIHGAKYPKAACLQNKWLVEEINMLYIRLLWERWS